MKVGNFTFVPFLNTLLIRIGINYKWRFADEQKNDGGGAPSSRGPATVVTKLRERHGTQVFPVPFAQAPFRIHSDARFSSVM